MTTMQPTLASVAGSTGTTSATPPIGWMELPFELKSKIAGHHIDNLLNDLRPSYYWYVDTKRVHIPFPEQLDWIKYHPFYQDWSHINILLGDMSAEMERLCESKFSYAFGGFSTPTELEVRRAQRNVQVCSTVLTIKTDRGFAFAEGELVAEGTEILQQVEELRALQRRYEQWLLLCYQDHRDRPRRADGARMQRIRYPPLVPFDYHGAAEENSRALESIRDGIWSLLEEEERLVELVTQVDIN